MRIQQTFKRSFPAVVFIVAVLSIVTIPSKAFAGMILDAELKLTYEDNVIGLLSDQQQGKVGTESDSMPMATVNKQMGGMGKIPYTGPRAG